MWAFFLFKKYINIIINAHKIDPMINIQPKIAPVPNEDDVANTKNFLPSKLVTLYTNNYN